MSAPPRTSSQDSTEGLRKRVCKACDRCRLKKSKCDGSNPCSRCRADNAICVFGERKKSHDKVYPKGYVEMLEHQQSQLISGLQDMYRRLQEGQLWPGDALSETEGHPLTHDILARLGILSNKAGTSDDIFEEDCDRLQQRLISRGASMVPARRGSVNSESGHSQTHSHKRSRSMIDSPAPSPIKPSFRKSFDFDTRRTSSPVSMSPVQPARTMHTAMKPSPLHTESPEDLDSVSPIDEENLLSNWDWQSFVPPQMPSQPEPQFSFQQPMPRQLQSHQPQQQQQQQQQQSRPQPPSIFDNWQGFDTNDMQFDAGLLNAFTNLTPGPSTTRGLQQSASGFAGANVEWQNVEVDFSKFVQVAAT